eukprot:PhF_6_TR38635/c0_g1_i3/m.57664
MDALDQTRNRVVAQLDLRPRTTCGLFTTLNGGTIATLLQAFIGTPLEETLISEQLRHINHHGLDDKMSLTDSLLSSQQHRKHQPSSPRKHHHQPHHPSLTDHVASLYLHMKFSQTHSAINIPAEVTQSLIGEESMMYLPVDIFDVLQQFIHRVVLPALHNNFKPIKVEEAKECERCGHIESQIEECLVLSVGVPSPSRSGGGNGTKKGMLQHLVNDQYGTPLAATWTAKNEYYKCTRCEHEMTSLIRGSTTLLHNPNPTLLLVHIKQHMEGGDNMVPFSASLTVGSIKYSLHAIVVYVSERKHFVCYRKVITAENPLGVWYLFDDAKVKPCAPAVSSNRESEIPWIAVYVSPNQAEVTVPPLDIDEELIAWIQKQDQNTAPCGRVIPRKVLTGLYNLGHASYACAAMQWFLACDDIREQLTARGIEGILAGDRKPVNRSDCVAMMAELCVTMQITKHRGVTPKDVYTCLPTPFNDYHAHNAGDLVKQIFSTFGPTFQKPFEIPRVMSQRGRWYCMDCGQPQTTEYLLPPESPLPEYILCIPLGKYNRTTMTTSSLENDIGRSLLAISCGETGQGEATSFDFIGERDLIQSDQICVKCKMMTDLRWKSGGIRDGSRLSATSSSLSASPIAAVSALMPPYLAVQFERFNPVTKERINHTPKTPIVQTVHLGDTLPYHLVAFIAFVPDSSRDHGHFVTYKKKQDSWFCIEDASYYACDISKIDPTTPYLFMYSREYASSPDQYTKVYMNPTIEAWLKTKEPTGISSSTFMFVLVAVVVFGAFLVWQSLPMLLVMVIFGMSTFRNGPYVRHMTYISQIVALVASLTGYLVWFMVDGSSGLTFLALESNVSAWTNIFRICSAFAVIAISAFGLSVPSGNRSSARLPVSRSTSNFILLVVQAAVASAQPNAAVLPYVLCVVLTGCQIGYQRHEYNLLLRGFIAFLHPYTLFLACSLLILSWWNDLFPVSVAASLGLIIGHKPEWQYLLCLFAYFMLSASHWGTFIAKNVSGSSSSSTT